MTKGESTGQREHEKEVAEHLLQRVVMVKADVYTTARAREESVNVKIQTRREETWLIGSDKAWKRQVKGFTSSKL